MSEDTHYPAPSPFAIQQLNALMLDLASRETLVDMSSWEDANICGATACLAGHAVLWNLRVHPTATFDFGDNRYQQEATRILYLRPEEAARLFHLLSWPQESRIKYRAAQAAAASLENIFNNNGNFGDLPYAKWTDREKRAYQAAQRRIFLVLDDRVRMFIYLDGHP